MWFVSDIAEKLEDIGDEFWAAYQDVKDWWAPFNELAYPLFYIADGFYRLSSRFWSFDKWLDELVALLAKSLTLENAYLYFKDYFDKAVGAWNWVKNASDYISQAVDDWWSSAKPTVQSWILTAQNALQLQINNLTTWLANIQAMLDELEFDIPNVSEILAWFTDWTGNVTSVINTWWTGALLDVKGLITSAFIERQSWWAGWADWRDKVSEFFTDPWEFLLNRFTDWFLGPEE